MNQLDSIPNSNSETETETETESELDDSDSEISQIYPILPSSPIIESFRDTFEDMLYLMLTDLDYSINSPDQDDSFWDPVIVRLDEDLIEDIPITSFHKGEDCTICTLRFFHLKQLPCCNNTMCTSCSVTWFRRSVFCPYCKGDIRENNI
jgi:hypothetical protein